MPVVYIGAVIGGFAAFKLADGSLWTRILWALIGAALGAFVAMTHK